MDKEKIENTVENIYEIKYELLDQKVAQKLKENKYRLKKTEENKIMEEIKERLMRKQIEQLLKEIDENNNIKSSIIMKEMYKQGFIDGVNLIIDCKTTKD